MDFTVTITRTISNFRPYEWEVRDANGEVVAFGQADSYDGCTIAVLKALHDQEMI